MGIVNVNVEPTSTWLLTQISPPCSSTNFRHKVSPSLERRWLARTVMTPAGPMVCDLVFHRDGRAIGDFRKAWAKACAAAGLAGALFHDFRRSSVRNLENAGTPRKVAKSITGHITDSVYERYHVVKEEDQRAALARVEAAFPPISRPSAAARVPSVS
jgi:integrase